MPYRGSHVITLHHDQFMLHRKLYILYQNSKIKTQKSIKSNIQFKQNMYKENNIHSKNKYMIMAYRLGMNCTQIIRYMIYGKYQNDDCCGWW